MKIVETALERFGLPSEAAGAGRITLTGCGHLSIENLRGLLEYSEDCISVALKKGRVSIRGRELSLSAMEGNSLVIRGKIQSVELE